MPSKRPPIRTFDDVTDLLAANGGNDGLCLAEEDFAPEFFLLRTGLAAELFQKVVNYRLRLAIVLPDPAKYGQRFSELALEHRTHPHIRFFASKGEAASWLRQ
jgi:hypothetical protein